MFSLGCNASYNFDIFGGHPPRARGTGRGGRLPGLRARRRAADAREQRRGDGHPASGARRPDRAHRSDPGGAAAGARHHRESAIELGRRRWSRCRTRGRSSRRREAELPPLRAQAPRRPICSRCSWASRPATADIPVDRVGDLRLPAELPLRLPSELVRQRRTSGRARRCCTRRAPTSGSRRPICTPNSSSPAGFRQASSTSAMCWETASTSGTSGSTASAASAGRRAAGAKRAAEAALRAGAGGVPPDGAPGAAERRGRPARPGGRCAGGEARSNQADRAEEAYRITLERFRAGGVSELAVSTPSGSGCLAEVESLQALGGANIPTPQRLFQALGGG